MNDLLIMALIIVGGIALMLIARFSRKKWESDQGKATTKEKLRSFFIFLAWFPILLICFVINPYILAIPLLLLSLGFLTLGRKEKGLYKDIVDMGIISFIFSPIMFIIVYNIF
jgi:uncharacterized membrane protein